MRTDQKIRVALVNPPLIGHSQRGTGVYTSNLYQALLHISGVEIQLVNYKANLSKYDLVHFPYFDPFFLTLPLQRTYKSVVTVHDLIPLKFPQNFPRGFKGNIKWKIQKLSLLRSSAIITDSIASKKDIIQFTGFNKDKVQVVPLGVDLEFKIISSNNQLHKTKIKYNLPDNFIMNVGDVNYNKNVSGLIKAFQQLTILHSNFYLVLVGRGFRTPSVQLKEINRLITQLKIRDKLIILGQVSLIELVCLYNLARVYVQPSIAEGFGLPVLEAMACGCPVIASNASSLPEVAGSSAILVDPENIGKLAQSISILYNNKIRRNYFVKKGLHRVKYFTWEKCALEMSEIYKNIFNSI